MKIEKHGFPFFTFELSHHFHLCQLFQSFNLQIYARAREAHARTLQINAEKFEFENEYFSFEFELKNFRAFWRKFK